MAITTVPLQNVANQSVGITLSGQACLINIRTLSDDGRQYFSLSVAGRVICDNVLMVNRHAIVQAAYTGFIGDFAAVDMQSDEPPVYTGCGTRWQLVYNDAVESCALR